MLNDFYNGTLVPNNTDPFPSIFFCPNLKGLSGPFLDLRGLEGLSLQDVQSKVLYKCWGPVESPGRAKKLNISNVCNSKSDYSFKEKFGRTTTYAMLIK